MERKNWLRNESNRTYSIERLHYQPGRHLFPGWGENLCFLKIENLFQNVVPREQRETAERQTERVKKRDERNYEQHDYHVVKLKPFEIDLTQ